MTKKDILSLRPGDEIRLIVRVDGSVVSGRVIKVYPEIPAFEVTLNGYLTQTYCPACSQDITVKKLDKPQPIRYSSCGRKK